MNTARLLLLSVRLLLYGVAAAVKFNPAGLPTIIWWTDLLYPHPRPSSTIQCLLGECMSTSRRRNYTSDNVAYLFYGTDFHGDDLPLPRQSDSVWALLHEESPMNNYVFSHAPGIRLFNYSSTFSRESDFPLTTQHLPSLRYLTEVGPMSIREKNDHRRRGVAPVLYLQSHCGVASDRDRYVRELMRFVDVDSYGACLRNRELPPRLANTDTHDDEELLVFISRYKFHLAFENAICEDYVTEKLFRAFRVGSVPIYRGSPSVGDWAPTDHSVIVADDFGEPSQLATFVQELDRDDASYERYLAYKHEGVSNERLKEHLRGRRWGVNDPSRTDFLRGFECHVCDRIIVRRRGGGAPPPPSVADRRHMDCRRPRASVAATSPPAPPDGSSRPPPQDDDDAANCPVASKERAPDEWSLEDWIESYFFAYDQARAIERMIERRENDSSRFMEYLAAELKYHHRDRDMDKFIPWILLGE